MDKCNFRYRYYDQYDDQFALVYYSFLYQLFFHIELRKVFCLWGNYYEYYSKYNSYG